VGEILGRLAQPLTRAARGIHPAQGMP